MKLTARAYQIKARDSVEKSKINLLTLPMRAGKSYISKLIIDKYSNKKALVIVGYRKIVLQFEQYFKDDSTFILAGKKFDHTKRVHLATFQTYQNRDIDINEYDLIVVDEYHSRQSAKVTGLIKEAKSNGSTAVLLTGTPLTNSNKIIARHIDTFIQPITVSEMINNKYLAPTRFFSIKDVLKGNERTLKTRRNDYTEQAVEDIISKTNLLDSIVEQVKTKDLDTKHNTLIYVNFISVAEKLYKLLSEYNNVNIIHSKMSNKEQEEALDKYHSGYGICISVRSLSLGFDSPKSDRLVFGLLTKIDSLSLQILWRSSTLDPNNPNKVAEVLDMTGQLSKVNPFTDFSEYRKHTPSCMEEAMAIPDEEMRHYAILGCEAKAPVSLCDGKLPSIYKDNPYIIDFQVIGKPCKEALKVHDFKYTTTESEEIKGIIYKWSKCTNCGTITKTVLKTMAAPSDLIEVYKEDMDTNRVIALYSKSVNKVLLIIDDIKLVSYKFRFASSQQEIFDICKDVLNGKSFTLSSNIELKKLDNANLNKDLDILVSMINWEDESKNTGLIRKLVKAKIDKLVESYGYSRHYTYYFMKIVTNTNLKEIVKILENKPTKTDINRFKLGYEEKSRMMSIIRPPDIDEDMPF